MISKIISVEIDDKELIKVKFDLNGFESHNKFVAKFDWHDENGNATKLGSTLISTLKMESKLLGLLELNHYHSNLLWKTKHSKII